jgi:hypothetical protein
MESDPEDVAPSPAFVMSPFANSWPVNARVPPLEFSAFARRYLL